MRYSVIPYNQCLLTRLKVVVNPAQFHKILSSHCRTLLVTVNFLILLLYTVHNRVNMSGSHPPTDDSLRTNRGKIGCCQMYEVHIYTLLLLTTQNWRLITANIQAFQNYKLTISDIEKYLC